MKKQDISKNQAKNVFLGIGSNLGNRIINIEKAKLLLLENDISFISVSNYYETPSWPDPKKPKFINIVLKDKLCLPHVRMHERNFVLFPLFEIEKNWVHPIKKVSIKKLIFSLPNKDIRSIKQI